MQTRQIIIKSSCFYFRWNTPFTAWSSFWVKGKICRFLVRALQRHAKGSNNNIYALMSTFLSWWLIFNCRISQELENQMFLNMNIHVPSPTFPAVASNVFPAIASRDIFRTRFDWFRCEHVVLLSLIRNRDL